MDPDLRYVLGLMRRTRSFGGYSAYIRKNRGFFSRIPRSASDQIQKNAKRQGMKEEMERGINQGRQQMCRLFQVLLADGRQGEFSRAVTDEVFQRRLFEEYRI